MSYVSLIQGQTRHLPRSKQVSTRWRLSARASHRLDNRTTTKHTTSLSACWTRLRAWFERSKRPSTRNTRSRVSRYHHSQCTRARVLSLVRSTSNYTTNLPLTYVVNSHRTRFHLHPNQHSIVSLRHECTRDQRDWTQHLEFLRNSAGIVGLLWSCLGLLACVEKQAFTSFVPRLDGIPWATAAWKA